MKKSGSAPRMQGLLRWAAGPILILSLLLMSPLNVRAALPVEKGEHLRLHPSPISQKIARNKAEQWQRMAPAEKETMRQRMDQWNQMAPQERQRYQHRYEQWKHLSPDEQRQIDRKLKSWPNLSPSEKEDVKSRFR